jgi:integrase
MTTATPSTPLATIQPAFTDAERLALAGFLAGYRGLTREAYALDLRQFTTWCRVRSVALFAVRRADIESFAREEARGRARATVTRRLSTIAGFFKYAVEEELPDHSPAAHVRRPRVDYESQAAALDRNELGALLVAAGLGSPAEHALISLLALNGLRVSEATGAEIEHLGLERGHRTLIITRKGRQGGHDPACAANRPGDRPGYRRACRRAGVPGCGRTAAGPARRRADRPPHRASRRDRKGRHAPHAQARLHFRRARRRVRCATSKKPRHMLIREPPCGMTAPAAAWTGTPPISSPPTSHAPPGNTPPGISFARRSPARRSWAGRFAVVTHCDLGASGNRCSYVCQGLLFCILGIGKIVVLLSADTTGMGRSRWRARSYQVTRSAGWRGVPGRPADR